MCLLLPCDTEASLALWDLIDPLWKAETRIEKPIGASPSDRFFSYLIGNPLR